MSECTACIHPASIKPKLYTKEQKEQMKKVIKKNEKKVNKVMNRVNAMKTQN